jgi:hypothetical protein
VKRSENKRRREQIREDKRLVKLQKKIATTLFGHILKEE